MKLLTLIPPAAAMLLAPLLFGVIHRTKAWFAGRQGRPLLQSYFDLWKLLHKGAVYSATTSWIFRAAPMTALAALLTASLLMPFGHVAAPLEFPADFLLFIGLLGLARFATVLAALDTGSSFEGMGASREVFFSALAEPVLLLALATLVRQAQAGGPGSLATVFQRLTTRVHWLHDGPILALVVSALLVVLLAENARVPVDDPQTHLELTMIHEVMVLDHSGPDLAFIVYGTALKLWLLAALVVGMVLPPVSAIWLNLLLATAGMGVTAVAVGVVESVMARLRLALVPQLLVGAGALAAAAFLLGLA